MTSIADARLRFRKLHESGFFILPNAWDAGSAVRLAALGFQAIASTSSGAAWAAGKEDGQLTRDEVLAHLRLLVGATDLPVNADFENGFADAPEDVAANVRLAIDTGVAGLSIEDWSGSALYDTGLAVERIAAVAPRPVNVLVHDYDGRIAEFARLGARRCSVGGSLAKASWNAFDAAARTLKGCAP